MKPKDVFTEFITLGYYPGKRPTKTKDLGLQDYVIVRTGKEGWYVLSFLTGVSIYIPWLWTDLFESLNTWGGHNILKCEELHDNIDYIIYDFLRLTICLSTVDRSGFLGILGRICNKGTKDFRDWFKFEFDTQLRPLEFNSLDNFRYI